MTIEQIASSGIMKRKHVKDDTLHTTVTQEEDKNEQGYKAEKKKQKNENAKVFKVCDY